MKKIAVALTLCFFLTGCSWFLPVLEDGPPEKVIVVFEDGSSLDRALKWLRDEGFTIYGKYNVILGVGCWLTPGQQEWVMKNLPVKYIEKDFEMSILDNPLPLEVHAAETPVTEHIGWGLEMVKAEEAWEIATGVGVRVGVIDTGLDSDHVDLTNACGSSAVVGGFSAFGGSWEDDNNHGIYVGTILAARKNGAGIVGVAPDAVLYAIKVLDSDGRGSVGTVLQGYDWALDQHLDVVNLSLGSFYLSRALEEAMIRAAWQGMGTIAATGNDSNGIIYPAKHPICVCVGAVGLNGQKMSWSNYGPALKANGVMAPGNWILAGNKGGEWQRISGTSAATPYVTGLVALLLDLSWAERHHIFESASLADAPTEEMGYGVIDVPAALQVMLDEAAAGRAVEFNHF